MSLLRQALLSLGLIAALAAYLWVSHHRLVNAQAAAVAANTRANDLSAQLTAAKQDVRIVTQYVDRVRTVQVRGRDIIRKVPVYVSRTADAGCTINRGFVRVLNAAATGVDLPAAASPADAAAAGIALSAVAGSVSDNYTTANTIREQLIALQTWVRVHSAPASSMSTGPP